MIVSQLPYTASCGARDVRLCVWILPERATTFLADWGRFNERINLRGRFSRQTVRSSSARLLEEFERRGRSQGMYVENV
jgi:hypothetical protein